MKISQASPKLESLLEQAELLESERLRLETSGQVLDASARLSETARECKAAQSAPLSDAFGAAWEAFTTRLGDVWTEAKRAEAQYGGASGIAGRSREIEKVEEGVRAVSRGGFYAPASFSPELNQAFALADAAAWVAHYATELGKQELSAKLEAVAEDQAPAMRELTRLAQDVFEGKRPLAAVISQPAGLPPLGQLKLHEYLGVLAREIERNGRDLVLDRDDGSRDLAARRPLEKTERIDAAKRLRKIAKHYESGDLQSPWDRVGSFMKWGPVGRLLRDLDRVECFIHNHGGAGEKFKAAL